MEEIKKITKVDIVKILISRDLLSFEIGDTIPSVKEYSTKFNMSVGSIQNALKDLEKEKVFELSNKGTLGKVLVNKDIKKIIQKSINKSIVAVMPLPRTRRYEGIATAIKKSFEDIGINFYFAYMSGSKIRLKLLREGIYDFVILSKLAYMNNEKFKVISCLELGENSYVSKHVVISKNRIIKENIRVGIDNNSEDQKYLSEKYYKNKNIKKVYIDSDDIIKEIRKGNIDEAILSIDEIEENIYEDILIKELDIKEKSLANIGIIAVRKEDEFMIKLLKKILSRDYIKKIQNEVLTNVIKPRY